MKAIIFNPTISRYLLAFATQKFGNRGLSCLNRLIKLKEIPQPKPPGDDWFLIRTGLCGICGSDLNAITGRESTTLEPYSSFPVVMGHEAVGTIIENGKNPGRFSRGDLVAVENCLPCATRDTDSPCNPCKDGIYHLCENFTEGNLGAGCINGFNRTVGGGWAEYMISHKSQLVPIPKNLSVEDAVLTDSISSALQGIVTHLPEDRERVVVYGCGIIGIEAIACLRALGFTSKIIAVAKYPFQRQLAFEAGVDHVITGKDVVEETAKICGSRILRPRIGGPILEGGVDRVFDFVGSATSINTSIRILKGRGNLILVGTAGRTRVDWARVWFKEIIISGSTMPGTVVLNGRKVRTYELALDLLSSGRLKTGNWLSHTFPIERYRDAVDTALDKKHNESVKVAFKF